MQVTGKLKTQLAEINFEDAYSFYQLKISVLEIISHLIANHNTDPKIRVLVFTLEEIYAALRNLKHPSPLSAVQFIQLQQQLSETITAIQFVLKDPLEETADLL